ncbi:uncharacterized protein [Rutidosis leptorrhynchoides]|uniref:uncharacterized protein n=1 Tax=Rutidosis leptorrhynchoides TaxID=125765 RepID=UPI003A993D05
MEPYCKSLNKDNNICVNVPLVDVLAGMPKYRKFLKDLTNKKEEGDATKLGDLGPFIVPCQVDGSELLKSLADSGASINLMAYTLYSRLNLGELKITNKGVRSPDQSVSRPLGIPVNLIVKVGELEFLADFMVVDMNEDKVVPLILGKPFLPFVFCVSCVSLKVPFEVNIV